MLLTLDYTHVRPSRFRMARRRRGQLTNQTENVPFQAGGKEYNLSFVSKDTSRVFPYSPYAGGKIVEVVWSPQDKAGEEKWERTKDNSLGGVREIVRTLPPLVTNWLTQNQPVGFYWKGNDPKLQSLWNRVTRGIDTPGYVRSKTKPNVFVKSKLQPYLDTQSLD